MSSCMDAVLSRSNHVVVRATISDALFVTCVNFLHKRYLYGQGVLACAVKEEVWFGIDAQEPGPPDEDQDLSLRALRMHAGATISLDSLLLCDVSSKRTMEMGTSEAKAACRSRMQKVLRTICELGLGEGVVESVTSSLCAVHKYSRCSLQSKAMEWLRANRVSLALFGPVCATAQPAPLASAGSDPSHPKKSTNNNKQRANTLKARSQKTQKTLFSDVIQEPIMFHADLKAHLEKRSEFKSYRVQWTQIRNSNGMFLCSASCLEDTKCPAVWETSYLLHACGSLRKGTLRILQCGAHDHSSGETNSGKLFNPATLAIAEAIVRDTDRKQLSFSMFSFQLQQRLQDQGLSEQDLPTRPQLTAWLKRAKQKKNNAALDYEPQKQSQHMVESIKIRLHDLRKWFTDRADELVILPDNPAFTSYLVSRDRTVVLFASKGMFNTLVKFVGERAYIVVDTKMKVLKNQRGVVTVYILVMDKLRQTTWHVDGRRVQGKALTSHSMPVLQGVIEEETEVNHDDVFKALKYLWTQAKPNGPPFEDVFRQIGKDFAPGIEAARRNELPFMRPADDFFHFMVKSKEMESRCHHITVGANGKAVKSHLGWARSVLYALQNGTTPDLLDKTWRGYLRRLVCKGELVLASYFFKEYSRVLTVQQLQTMNVFPNEPSVLARMFFLSWSAGFSMFPGLNSGSLAGEAAHSPWQKKLEEKGQKLGIGRCYVLHAGVVHYKMARHV